MDKQLEQLVKSGIELGDYVRLKKFRDKEDRKIFKLNHPYRVVRIEWERRGIILHLLVYIGHTVAIPVFLHEVEKMEVKNE